MRGARTRLCNSRRCDPARAAALGWLTDSATLSAGHRLETSIAPTLSFAALIEALAWWWWWGGGWRGAGKFFLLLLCQAMT